jgi:hypothetical protein
MKLAIAVVFSAALLTHWDKFGMKPEWHVRQANN